MIVITVVYARERSFARSSTTSRTVACRRFQRRSITAVSSGPRNVFGPRRRARFRRRTSSAMPRSSHLSPQIAASLEQKRVPLARVEQELATVREDHVQRDDEVTIARRVERATGSVPPLDEPREGHRGELAFGVRLVEAGPERRPWRGVLTDRQGVEELQPRGVGERVGERRGAVIGVIVRALQQPRVAVEEVEVPVDQAVLPAAHTTSV